MQLFGNSIILAFQEEKTHEIKEDKTETEETKN